MSVRTAATAGAAGFVLPPSGGSYAYNPEPGDFSSEVTVSSSGADYTSVNAALAATGNGTIITVLDDASVAPWSMSTKDRVWIRRQTAGTLTSVTANAYSVCSVTDCTYVTIQGFHFVNTQSTPSPGNGANGIEAASSNWGTALTNRTINSLCHHIWVDACEFTGTDITGAQFKGVGLDYMRASNSTFNGPMGDQNNTGPSAVSSFAMMEATTDADGWVWGMWVENCTADGIEQSVDSTAIGQSVPTDGNGFILDGDHRRTYVRDVLFDNVTGINCDGFGINALWPTSVGDGVTDNTPLGKCYIRDCTATGNGQGVQTDDDILLFGYVDMILEGSTTFGSIDEPFTGLSNQIDYRPGYEP
ncbi:MAG: hypothetical protein GY925_17810 [Actinomycetia bacterium]|nr:hypothetical protein [Actinomycetes bacterium]